VVNDKAMRERLQKYPGPFVVKTFAEPKTIQVYDGNGSLCSVCDLVEWALNFLAKQKEPAKFLKNEESLKRRANDNRVY